ncbi:MAG: NAD-dependent epimerase/dehydratase family protein [Chitinophagaceae bacterium]
MKILVTGASGYIGNKLAHALAARGEEVHALVRSNAADTLLQHPAIKIFKGDILQKESLLAAMKGCKQVYHTAARVGVWAKDPSVFYAVNVTGTANVLNAAFQSGVDKTVFTSTCGVIGPSVNEPIDENTIRTTGFDIDYDRSKKMAEELITKYSEKAMKVVIVSPSKVYGPGQTSHSLTANAIIYRFLKKKITFVPLPGTFRVCFAFINDIINGHLLAMEKGIAGEKYILGGVNISYLEFFNCVRALAGGKGHIIQLPKRLIILMARMQSLNYKNTGAPICFTVQSVNYLFNNFTFSSAKATRDLGYKITSVEEALIQTIYYLNYKLHE